MKIQVQFWSIAGFGDSDYQPHSPKVVDFDDLGKPDLRDHIRSYLEESDLNYIQIVPVYK